MYNYIHFPEATIDNIHKAAVDGRLLNMTSSKCMESFGVKYVSKFSNVLLVTSRQEAGNNSLISLRQWRLEYEIPYFWICGDGFSPWPDYQTTRTPVCTLTAATTAASTWTVSGFPISYCMVLENPERCSLSVSFLFLVALELFILAKGVTSMCAQNFRLFFSCGISHVQTLIFKTKSSEAAASKLFWSSTLC